MKKLENIPKKNIFEVPEGYFEKLPTMVQSRVSEKKDKTQFLPGLSFSLRYALPIVLLAVIGIFWYKTSDTSAYLNTQEQLEQVSEDQLSIYLSDADLSTEELVETMTWSEDDLQELEEQVYTTFEVTSNELEKVLDDF